MDDHTLTPARCEEYAERLDAALETLRSIGVTIAPEGRLPTARALLRKVAADGVFPDHHVGRTELLAALRDAAEWHMIAACLDRPSGEFLNDVQRAVEGPPTGSADALRVQAQLFFGAILVQDGLGLGAPTRSGFPDFAVRDGTLHHGIEVKAPVVARGIDRAIRTADQQLSRLSGGGMAVLDVSLLLWEELTRSREELVAPPDVVEARVRRAMQPFKARIRKNVVSRQSWTSGRGVIASVALARVHHWECTDAGMIPRSAISIAWRRYYQTRGTLGFWRATALGNRVGHALRALVPDLRVTWED